MVRTTLLTECERQGEGKFHIQMGRTCYEYYAPLAIAACNKELIEQIQSEMTTPNPDSGEIYITKARLDKLQRRIKARQGQ
jgi:hypothetical protein